MRLAVIRRPAVKKAFLRLGASSISQRGSGGSNSRSCNTLPQTGSEPLRVATPAVGAAAAPLAYAAGTEPQEGFTDRWPADDGKPHWLLSAFPSDRK